MSNGASTVNASRSRRSLAYLAVFIAGGLGLSATYAATGVGIACPFRTLTGWSCPFCGGTRMGAALLHGDLPTAFWLSPASFVVVLVVLLVAVVQAVEAVGGPALRPPAGVVRGLRRIRSWQWLVVGLGLAVGWTLVRNLG